MQAKQEMVHVNGGEQGFSRLATKSVRPVLVSILLVVFAELLLFSGLTEAAILIHMLVLIGVSISTIRIKDKYVIWALQALMMLPLLRLINFSMPVFSGLALYRYFYIYTPLFIPLFLIIRYQNFTLPQLGLSFKNFVLYLPLSIIIGLVMAEGEYLILTTNSLVPNMSIDNVVDLALIMIFCVGLVEELIFRSLLQTRLEGVFGATSGLIVTSLLFGMMSSGYGTIYELFFTFVAGLILGYMFRKTHSLPFVALIHGFVNIFLFGLIPLLGPRLGIF